MPTREYNRYKRRDERKPEPRPGVSMPGGTSKVTVAKRRGRKIAHLPDIVPTKRPPFVPGRHPTKPGAVMPSRPNIPRGPSAPGQTIPRQPFPKGPGGVRKPTKRPVMTQAPERPLHPRAARDIHEYRRKKK